MRGREPLRLTCPDCGDELIKVCKGWLCPNEGCSLIRVRGHHLWGKAERVEREARPRPRPLSREELRTLLEPYMTPGVERLLNK